MRHTKKEVIARTRREYAILDRLVAWLRAADWKRRVPRPPTRDPWTVKDALAHIVYWKEHSARVFRGERRLPEMRGLDVNAINRLIYRRWRRRQPRELVAWHRQVQRDVLKTLAANPPEWFSRRQRSPKVAARLRRALGGPPPSRHRGRAGAGARHQAPAPLRRGGAGYPSPPRSPSTRATSAPASEMAMMMHATTIASSNLRWAM